MCITFNRMHFDVVWNTRWEGSVLFVVLRVCLCLVASITVLPRTFHHAFVSCTGIYHFLKNSVTILIVHAVCHWSSYILLRSLTSKAICLSPELIESAASSISTVVLTCSSNTHGCTVNAQPSVVTILATLILHQYTMVLIDVSSTRGTRPGL